MPYIRQELRDELESEVFRSLRPESAGELTYLVYRLCQQFVRQTGVLRFAAIATVMGSLFCAALEFYRRCATPYEDERIKVNGDVL